MKPYVLLCALSCAAWSQVVTGIIEKTGKDQFELKTAGGVILMHVDENTSLNKVRASRDLSRFKPGDEVRVNYYGQESMTAVNIAARVTVSGVVRDISGSGRMLTITPDAKSAVLPAEGKKDVFVFLEAGVKLAVNRSQLSVGRRIHVTGWDSGEGVIDADKLAVYETDLPARR